MSSSPLKSFNLKSLLSVQAIVLAGILWSVLALMFFLLFSVAPEGGRPLWYSIGTSVFELVAYLGAALLCLRNWRSSQIVSGRNVWLGIGLGMFSYFIGTLLFTYWEIGLGQDPAVSPGDFFYVLAYLFLGWGMAMAVFSRRLTLEIWQWSTVAGIAVVSILVAWLVSAPVGQPSAQNFSLPFLEEPALAATTVATAPKPPSAPPKPATASSGKPAVPAKPMTASAPAAKPATATTAPAAKPATTAPSTTPAPEPPQWAQDLEQQLAFLEPFLTLFYVISDVALLILATTLLLAFWGGRFSQSWRMIAAATFSLYIADTWFRYASRFPNYESGGLLEVFWIFSGVLFGIGAALEYDLSTRSRRTSGRRRG